MIDRLDPIAIYTDWQQQIDESVEAGEALLIEFGVSDSVLRHLPALLALDRLAAERTDFAIPWFLVGGDGTTWMAALMSSASRSIAGQSPAMVPLYGGADWATYLATVATVPGASTYLRNRIAAGVPASMHALLIPTTQPGAVLRWLSLPFLLLTPAQSMPAVADDGDRGNGNASDPVATPDPWVEWLTLLTVVGLLIMALFI
ncbi:MAG: hypothetical protein R3E79_19115 [Caldilineaceae bacterium]